MYRFKLLKWLLVFSVFLAGCDETPQNEQYSTFEAIKSAGKLRIVTRNAPTSWYINADGQPTGFEYDLGRLYSQYLGLEPEFIVEDSIGDVFNALSTGKADIAAAGLTVLESRKHRFLVGPAYDSVHQVLVCHRDGFNPEGYDELSEVTIRVVADSSYAERLAEIKQNKNTALAWQETDRFSTEELLEQVAEERVDCTVADSTIVKINRRYFPELRVMMQITDSQPVALYLPAGAHELQTELEAWFKQFQKSAQPDRLEDRYYGYFREFDYVDVSVLKRRIDKRLPRYKKFFRVAAERYDLPLTTLLAQAYQESHWDPDAVSPTGVKGIMMLTRNTAEAMDVVDRTDAKQSIMGGARYLRRMMSRFRDEVMNEDRLYLGLAAYNIGRGHMHDAQSLARQLNLNPYVWHDMKQVLPLLTKKKYYKNLRYGYARGTEPVRYVQRIREYQHILGNELE
jgi:membrane-bound lytic murein transglycosylase F